MKEVALSTRNDPRYNKMAIKPEDKVWFKVLMYRYWDRQLTRSQFVAEGSNYINLEPRIAMAYKVNPSLAFKASYAQMNQYIHLLSNTGIGLPTDLWVPTTSLIQPQFSEQVAIGVSKDFKQNGLSLI